MNHAVQQLAKRLTGLVAKRPSIVVGIWGEPGIGKTHTVKGLLRQTPCRSSSFEATISPIQLARALPKPSRLPVWAERTLERETSALTDAIGALLSGLAPFILHLEDVQAAPPAQLEFIQALAKIIGQLKGVGLIVTSRQPPPLGFEAIRLEPLSSQAVHAMLQAEVSADLPEAALAWIDARAAGNPLFSLEFFKYLARQGFVWSDGQKWRWRSPTLHLIPATIEVLIEQIIANTAPRLEPVIHAKAFLGREADLILWALVANVTPKVLESAKTELERQGILFGGQFSHPLYAEVIGRSLPAQKRRVLARRAIEALANNPQTAANFITEAQLEPTIALQILRQAEQQALSQQKNVAATRFLARAVEYVPLEERADLAFKAAEQASHFDVSLAAKMLELVVKKINPSEEEFLFATEFLAQHGQAEQALLMVKNCASPEATRLTHEFNVRVLSGDLAGAFALWQQQPVIESAATPRILSRLVMALVQSGQAASAERIARLILAHHAATIPDTMNAKNHLAAALLYQGKPQQAEALWTELLALEPVQNDARFIKLRGSALVNLAQLRLQGGQLERGLEDIKAAAQTFLEFGNLHYYAYALVMLGVALTKRGVYEQAEETLFEAKSLLHTPSLILIDAELALSAFYVDSHARQASYLAIRHATAALGIAKVLGNPMMVASAYQSLAYAKVMGGQVEAGLIDLAAHYIDQPVLQIQSQNVRGLAFARLGQQQAALEAFECGLGYALKANLQEAEHSIRLEIARLQADLRAAKDCLIWFETHGLVHMTNLVRRYFPSLSEDVAVPLAQIRLEVFGVMQLVTQASSVPIRGGKRRELLALLLEARIGGRRELSKLKILDGLYPNTDEMQANTLLRDVIYQIREIGGSSLIITTENGYALGEVSTDAEVFLETGDTTLWRGAYLESLNLERNNETVQETLYLALQTHGEKLLETDPTEAARVGRLLSHNDPYNLEALYLTIHALKATKNHKTLSRVYKQAQVHLLEIGEVLPERWQDFLEIPIGINT